MSDFSTGNQGFISEEEELCPECRGPLKYLGIGEYECLKCGALLMVSHLTGTLVILQ